MVGWSWSCKICCWSEGQKNTRSIGHSVKTFGWSPLSGACQWTSLHRGSAKKISDVPRVSVLLIAPTITISINIYLSARNRAAETHLCHRPLAFLQGRVLSLDGSENNRCHWLGCSHHWHHWLSQNVLTTYFPWPRTISWKVFSFFRQFTWN